MTKERIKWHFIPSHALYFDCLWEATVKTFKKHFYRIVGETLTFEETSTFVSQVEASLNLSLLIIISSDPNDMSYILEHFFISDTMTSYPEPNLMQIVYRAASRANASAFLETLSERLFTPITTSCKMKL